ncbi:MAG TPA: hypothetical protein VES01_01495 [Dermatophilaceae bacterium]|nr:hypothetical protein [Dermatophilaceae bacterium]
MVQDVMGSAEAGLPPCRGQDPEAVGRYIVACRASAVVVGREGHSDAAARLAQLAARAEQQLAHVPRGDLVAAA